MTEVAAWLEGRRRSSPGIEGAGTAPATVGRVMTDHIDPNLSRPVSLNHRLEPTLTRLFATLDPTFGAYNFLRVAISARRFWPQEVLDSARPVPNEVSAVDRPTEPVVSAGAFSCSRLV